MKRKYETLVLLKPDSPQEKTQTVLDKVQDIIEKNDGFIIDVDHWGKKKLAYEVQKQSKGLYLLYTYLAPGPLVQELERNLRISQEVMKFLTVLLSEKVDEEEEKTRAMELQKARAEAAARAAEALELAAAEQALEAERKAEQDVKPDEEDEPDEPGDADTDEPHEESESEGTEIESDEEPAGTDDAEANSDEEKEEED